MKKKKAMIIKYHVQMKPRFYEAFYVPGFFTIIELRCGAHFHVLYFMQLIRLTVRTFHKD